jgi:putative ABC transport system permease protein
MFRTALRNVLAHKARLLMTVLAVMLGVSFVAGTLVFTDTIGDAFKKSSAKSHRSVSVAITPDSGSPYLSDRLLTAVRALPGTQSATGSVSGFTAVADKKGKLIGSGWSTTGANDAGAAKYPMADGRAPRTSSEVALDRKTADRAGYKVGDTVRMSVDGPVLKQTVTGIFTTDDGNVAAGGSLVLFDTATAQKLFAKPGQYSEIDLKAAAGTSQAALKAEVDSVLPAYAKGAGTVTGQQLADDEAKQISSSLSGFNTALLAFAGIALFVGIFIIANTFTMLVAQRTKELALLRAVGASRRQVTRSVLIEALLVGLVAGVSGLALGIGIAVGMRALLGATGATLPDGALIVQPMTVVAALAVGVGVTVLAAWLPARRAAKIPPVAAMSSVHAPATTKGLVVRNTLGAVVSAAGIALVLAATGMKDGGNAPMGAGAALLLVGVFILTPLLSRPVIAAAGPLLRPFGITGKLARQNSVRNPRRTAATASALMIGLTLITGLTVIATSVQSAINKMATDSLKADYQISMANFRDLSPDVEKKLSRMDQVTASSGLRNSMSEMGSHGNTAYLTGVDAGSIGKLVRLDFSSGSLGTLGGRTAVVDSDTAKQEGWKTGETVPVVYDDGKKGRLTIGGVYKGNELLSGVLVDEATLAPHMEKVADMKVLVKTAGGPSTATKDAIEKALGDNPAVKVQDKAAISQEISSFIGLLLNILYGLLAMAVLVAVLGVVNTLAMSVFERSHEIGMLRAIGLDRSAVKRMVRLESLIISLFGAVLGIGLGVFFGWAAGQLIAGSLDTYAMVLPWARIGLFLALAALVGVLAALWPARRAARLHMLGSIKAE